MNRFGLFNRLTIGYGVLGFVVMFVIGLAILGLNLVSKHDEQMQAFETTVAVLEKAVASGMIADDLSAVKEMMEWAALQGEFQYVALVDYEGYLLFHKEAEQDSSWLPNWWHKGGHRLERTISVGEQPYGMLVADFAEKRFMVQELHLFGYVALFAVLAGLAIWLVSHFVMRKAFRPLLKLKEAIDGIENLDDDEMAATAQKLLDTKSDSLASKVREKVAKAITRLMDYKHSLDLTSAVLELDDDFRIVYANAKSGEMGGGLTGAVYVVEGWTTEAIKAAVTSEGIWQAETKALRADGQIYWSSKTIVALREFSQGKYLVMETDTTSQKEAETALELEKLEIETTLGSLVDSVLSVDEDGVIRYTNKNFNQTFGLGRHIEGTQVAEWLDQFSWLNPRLLGLPSKEQFEQLFEEGGREHTLAVTYAPKTRPDGTLAGTVIVIRDVTLTRRLEAELTWKAGHDALTGLYNRAKFEILLAELLAEKAESGREGALLYLDLDQFKVINDTCGHSAGDDLIQHVTLIVRQVLRDEDKFARMGGDEFGVLLRKCSRAEALVVAERIRTAIGDFRFAWKTHLFKLGCSIGLVPLERGRMSGQEALAAADSACYLAKEAGRDRVWEHKPDKEESLRRVEEMGWISAINTALDQDGFLIYAQEVRALKPGLPEKIEILTRMKGKDGNVILPGIYIPAAERYQMMHKIDEWVVNKTIACLSDSLAGFDTMVCINLSANSLSNRNFADYVEKCFVTHGVDPKRVCFEVTETAAISSLAIARDALQRFRQIGATVALDDFGAGFSSFAYLRTLPVDFLKLDGSYVKTMLRDPVSLEMTRSFITVAHAMDLKVIAEFVESEAIVDVLREMGCDYAQGFHIHKPEPMPDYRRKLEFERTIDASRGRAEASA